MESREVQISWTRNWSAFAGAEDLISSRPLTYQSSVIKYNAPLTLNHFLIGRSGGDFAAKGVDDTCYNQQNRWRRTQELVKHIWRRWMQE